MIKSLLEQDDEQTGEIKQTTVEKAADDSAIDEEFAAAFARIESPDEQSETGNLSEISEPADDELIVSEKPEAINYAEPPAEKHAENIYVSEPNFDQPESAAETVEENQPEDLFADFSADEINFDLPEAAPVQNPNHEATPEISTKSAVADSPAETINAATADQSPADAKTENSAFGNSDAVFQLPAEPESFAETARKSGLAYAAAITLFGAIVFMLIIGWFADLLFGSSPWGIVGGIILGAIIGFLQFFRLTAQIFRNEK